ncbi:hypothetical protein R5R35_004596 [Gryllus longicercus]|uniref:PPM-type phosphatase domain-containing protein n=1 Tax=Gryllus longicercus TaxID=2509291 RepID=A0AAN9W4C3_9ORTH
MPSSIGVNLRVTGHCSQGSRKYMEDMFSVAYQRTEDEKDLEYAFFGIFDGHGGSQAATFAKEHLLDNIVNQKCFWSDKDAEVLRAIREGFLQTHLAMWRQLDRWPKTPVGFPSTSGTTASIAFIRRGKIYIGHVGDSAIVLGSQEDDKSWKGIPLTREHKPESEEETQRIEQAGGKVAKKSGVSRVVWNRPRLGHQGPVRRSTHIDEIPFLAVARSLGDLWSYNPALDVFVVSPEPEVSVHTIDVSCHRCLIFGTDGLWNVMSPSAAVLVVQTAESRNEQHLLQQGSDTGSEDIANGNNNWAWVNPSKSLVDRALGVWRVMGLQADNTSVVTLMLDPPGPPRVQVLLSQRQQQQEILEHSSVSSLFATKCAVDKTMPRVRTLSESPAGATPSGGVTIYTRDCDSDSRSGNPSPSPASPMSSSSPPVALMCLQVNSAAAVTTSPSSIKNVSSPGCGDKLCSSPISGSDYVSKPSGFKRRHSSGITQPVISAIEKRKRTRSEQDCLSKDRIKDEDLAASDVENDRVTWPPWNAAQTPSCNKLLQHNATNKYSGPRCGKSVLPLVPASGENSNSRCPLRSDSSASPSRWTLRSRNDPADRPAKAERETKISERLILPQSGRLSPVHRQHRRTSWSHTSQPSSMCTRSKGRQHSTQNK